MKRVIIMGAAGRDFHNFNVCFRYDPAYQVVAFTAAQIPYIEDRVYPTALAGPAYPQGVPIYPESELCRLIDEHQIDQVVLAYSDIAHAEVMHIASRVLACGADFCLLGPRSTMLKSQCPVVAVTSVRTGSGKSQTTRYVARLLAEEGRKVVVIRHPMPYGRLAEEAAVQRYADYSDLDKYDCTIEEREEYEPHLDAGRIVYAGIDYEEILHQAESEADIIVWDGGNNDFPFLVPDLHIVVADPHRAGDEISYHPGETNLRMADIVIINKVDSAEAHNVQAVEASIAICNPGAQVILANSPIYADEPALVSGKKVLVIEDGPTLTHGGMAFGAGVLAAERFGAGELIDPRGFAVGSIAETLKKWPHLSRLLPAMGYSRKQIRDLEETINRSPAQLVLIATPIDLRRIMKIDKPALRVKYELEEIKPRLAVLLRDFLHSAESS
ncbi:MAG: cyclic 2,3-diphosphoglycerate synthase [Syntrophomonadaceae bacterium]